MRPPGRKAAFLSMGIASVILVALGVAAKDLILEEWYLHQLKSPEEKTRLHAAEALGGMKSIRAVPRLLGLLRLEGCEVAYYTNGSQPELEPGYVMTPLAFSLYSIGEGALPKLQEEERRKHVWSARFYELVSSIIAAIALPGKVNHVVSYEAASQYLLEWKYRTFLEARKNNKQLN